MLRLNCIVSLSVALALSNGACDDSTQKTRPSSGDTVPESGSGFSQKVRTLRGTGYSFEDELKLEGPPVEVPTLKGSVGEDGLAITETTTHPEQLVSKGARRAIGKNETWTLVPAGAAVEPDLDWAALPAEELNELLAHSQVVGEGAGDHLKLRLDASVALSYLQRSLRGRMPAGLTPKLTIASSQWEVWLTGGKPTRYVITVRATAALPIGMKDIGWSKATTIREVGHATAAVPAAARRLVEGGT